MKLGMAVAATIVMSLSCGSQTKNTPLPGNPCAGKTANPCASKTANPCAGKTANPCGGTFPSILSKTRQNTPPQLRLPSYTTVGVGQRVHFPIEVVDRDNDTFSVQLIDKPASAKYDPLTLTVDWTPRVEDKPLAKFRVRIVEREFWSNHERTFEHTFSIGVGKRQILAQARPLGPAVETLITIHDPARLKVANRKWSFLRMLDHSADLLIGALPAAMRNNIKKPSRQALYRSFLEGLAEIHNNPRLDPTSPKFDRRSFGDPNSWKLITVRPRLDKAWQELRMVYRAMKAPEPAFAMFRVRPVRTGPLPADAQMWNNKEFSRLTAAAFFDKQGKLRPELFKSKQLHARAVANYVTSVLTYKNTAKPYTRATFIALATGARLGGGSKRDATGNYLSGDGWAWSALKPLPTKDGKSVAYTNIRIKGFWTAAAKTPDGSKWHAVCAPRFDPADKHHAPGYEVLCRKKIGLVDFPAVENGKVIAGKKEATNLYVKHKRIYSVKHLPLRDPRRDLGEEKGMTCSQCHTRSFGQRDLQDKTLLDARAGVPKKLNKTIGTSFFIIVPTERWAPFLIDFQQDQECKAKRAFKKYLGLDTDLRCPLAPKLTSNTPAAALRRRVVTDFERAVLAGRHHYVQLFDFVTVGTFEKLLRRHDLYGRWPNPSKQYLAQLRADTPEPYPAERERKNVGNFYGRFVSRTVGRGGCAPSPIKSAYVQKLGTPFRPLPAGNDRYVPMRRTVNPLIAAGGVVGVRCKTGKGGLALVYTRRDSPRGYDLITMYDDP